MTRFSGKKGTKLVCPKCNNKCFFLSPDPLKKGVKRYSLVDMVCGKCEKKAYKALVDMRRECDVCGKYKYEFAHCGNGDESTLICESCYPLLNDGLDLETAKMLAYSF